MPLNRMVMELGIGTDLRGQDYTKAAIRAVKDALWRNSLTVAPAFGLPGDAMQIEVHIGAGDPDAVDCEAVAAAFPYGAVTVLSSHGGMDIPKEDPSESTILVNAAVVVYLDLPAEAEK